MILKLSDGIRDSGIGLKTGLFPRVFPESGKPPTLVTTVFSPVVPICSTVVKHSGLVTTHPAFEDRLVMSRIYFEYLD